jgi:hypothetical protein
MVQIDQGSDPHSPHVPGSSKKKEKSPHGLKTSGDYATDIPTRHFLSPEGQCILHCVTLRSLGHLASIIPSTSTKRCEERREVLSSGISEGGTTHSTDEGGTEVLQEFARRKMTTAERATCTAVLVSYTSRIQRESRPRRAPVVQQGR